MCVYRCFNFKRVCPLLSRASVTPLIFELNVMPLAFLLLLECAHMQNTRTLIDWSAELIIIEAARRRIIRAFTLTYDGFRFNPSIRLLALMVDSFLGHRYRALGSPPCRWNLILRLNQSYYCSPRQFVHHFPATSSIVWVSLLVSYLTQHLRQHPPLHSTKLSNPPCRHVIKTFKEKWALVCIV